MAIELLRKPRGFYDKEKFCEKRLCAYIDSRRKALKLSQADMGKVIGISQQAFGKKVDFEKGSCKLSAMHLAKILDKLQATDEERAELLKIE